jgi:hypothetical protein
VNTRKSILVFMYSERIKSELIIASDVLEKMLTLVGEERKGAEKLMLTYLERLVGEIKIAQGIEKSINFLGAEKKITEAIGRIQLSEFSEINRCISDSLSFITISSQKAMEILEQRHLL